MKEVVVYNEKWYETCGEAVDEAISEYDDIFMGLSPDNTLYDLVSVLMESCFKTIIGEECLNMTLGEFMKLPKDEAVEKLFDIFDLDKLGYTETYRPVV